MGWMCETACIGLCPCPERASEDSPGFPVTAGGSCRIPRDKRFKKHPALKGRPKLVRRTGASDKRCIVSVDAKDTASNGSDPA